MRTPTAILAIGLFACLSAPAMCAEPYPCDIPGYLLFGGNDLKHVAEVVKTDHRLTIAVIGTGS